jgi:hypothetical protein
MKNQKRGTFLPPMGPVGDSMATSIGTIGTLPFTS